MKAVADAQKERPMTVPFLILERKLEVDLQCHLNLPREAYSFVHCAQRGWAVVETRVTLVASCG